MKNLTSALNDKTLSELEPVEKVSGKSNLIEPTKVEIMAMIAKMKEGKNDKEVKKEVRRSKDGAQLGFSYAQIKEVRVGWMTKLAELGPVEEI